MKDIDFDSIGKKLKEIRQNKNFTQEFVATSVGVNTSHISNIENGKVKISLTTLVNVCNTLGTTVDYVLKNEYNDTSSAVDNAILSELQKCNRETKERILKIVQILQSNYISPSAFALMITYFLNHSGSVSTFFTISINLLLPSLLSNIAKI